MINAKDIQILIVDDEEDFRHLLTERFTLFGFSTESAPGGDPAWTLLQKNDYSIVITDIRMAEGDGISLVARLRDKSVSHPKVFVISGYSDFNTAEILHMGADGFFPKPFQASDLRTTIQKAMVDRRERWRYRGDHSDLERLSFQWPDWATAQQNQWFEMGRGGFYCRTEKLPLQGQQNLQFQIQFEKDPSVVGSGRILWREPCPQNSEEIWVGIEITELKPESLGPVAEWIEKEPPLSFIPYPLAKNK